MARIELIIAKLPALITDRADFLKLETAIRYVGGIIFDASQNRSGDKARALAEILSGPTSLEKAQSREAILTLFREGYLDRYADYAAWRDIALAAGISSDPARMDPFNQESATVDTPRVVVLTGKLNAPTPSIEAVPDGPERVKSVDALKLIIPTPRKIEPARRLKIANEAASNEAAGERVKQGAREPKESYSRGFPRVGPGGEARDRTRGATGFLEITSLKSTDRSSLEFAKKFKDNTADKLSEMEFPCLIGFVPKISIDERSVEWANPVTADSFRDHGHRLTSGSPSRLAIRAMLELARADNWTRVAVKGSVRLQAFAEATAVELDRGVPVSPKRGTADPWFDQIPRPWSVRLRVRRPSHVVGMTMFVFVLVGMGFSATYIYLNPQLQAQLGVESFINNLPWNASSAHKSAAEEHTSPDGQLVAFIISVIPRSIYPDRLGDVGVTLVESRVQIRNKVGELLYSRDYTSDDGEHGFFVEKAEWSADSEFFVFSMVSSGGHMSWRSLTFFYVRRDNQLRDLEDLIGNRPILSPNFASIAPHMVRITTWTKPPLDPRNEIAVIVNLNDGS